MKKHARSLSAILAAAVILSMAAMPVHADRLKTENGILYRYGDNSEKVGKYTGWAKYKDGTRKYFLDGYFVTGEMPVGKNICVFDENGVLTEKKPAEIIITQDAPVHSGDKTISVTAKPLGNGVYSMYPVSKLERWKKGKWEDCLGKDVEYVTCDCLYVLDAEGVLVQDKISEEKIDFYPEEYMGTKITAGYYRMTFPASGGSVYVIIQVADT